MAMNPMTMFSEEQQKMLAEVQKFTTDIHAVIKKEGEGNFIVVLNTTNPEAQQYLPQIRVAMINSLASTLYTLFNIQGHIE